MESNAVKPSFQCTERTNDRPASVVTMDWPNDRMRRPTRFRLFNGGWIYSFGRTEAVCFRAWSRSDFPPCINVMSLACERSLLLLFILSLSVYFLSWRKARRKIQANLVNEDGEECCIYRLQCNMRRWLAVKRNICNWVAINLSISLMCFELCIESKWLNEMHCVWSKIEKVPWNAIPFLIRNQIGAHTCIAHQA